MTVNEIYQSGLKLLENNNIENSKFEAQSLLQKAFSLDRIGFIIHKTDKADENCSHNFLKFIEKRISGEPLQYILGEWSFMGFDFKVGRGVLIPRDDTEVVVNLCIDFLKNRTDKKIIIAVDGFSSCGKSTFAKAIAARLGYIFIDTGAMYRAVTLYALDHGAIRSGVVDEDAVRSLLGDIEITFRFNPERGASDIYVNGDLAEGRIRTIEVSNCVSGVSSIREVREKLVAMQQRMGRNRGVVMDGRDIGTVVFPDAELKIFMTADPEVRADRRYAELTAKGMKVTREEVLANVLARDEADMHRAISPLRKADDAIVLDNSHMSVEEQMEWFMQRYEEACSK